MLGFIGTKEEWRDTSSLINCYDCDKPLKAIERWQYSTQGSRRTVCKDCFDIAFHVEHRG